MKLHLYLILFLILLGCAKKDSGTLFDLVDSEHHGMKFNNTIFENDTINILKLEYVYNGGAVAIGDFNNDGLSDVYLGGNMVPDKLYLNSGELKFKDITVDAGITENKKWRSGVALADVNGDGWLDIYVCATINPSPAMRANMLYLNQGLNADGIPTFKEEAAKYGIADTGYSSNAAFLDYDNDGDLDLYVLTNIIEKGIPTTFRPKIDDGSALNTDRLYRNNGNGTFTNVTKEAGVIHEGYGLGLAIADINKDGWQDIYVSNDYIANDILYINNKNGTFTNEIDKWIKHQSQFSMGNDVSDINNDGLPDIVTLDMLPEGNLRRKTVIGGPGYITYINNKQYGYTHQYIRNMLQLNNGNGTFSEIGHLAGVSQTEWSWSPLFADFDNNGYRDLIITNGFPRDITDKDFSNFRGGPGGNVASTQFLLDSIPIVKIPNYAFKNGGDLVFKDVTKEWGMSLRSFSNGASFADFDNDGDLDYIVNNINDEVSLYRNNLYSENKKKSDSTASHYLRVKLIGKEGNPAGLGTKMILKYNGKQQYYDHSVYRGYISTVEGIAHFGLGKQAKVDSVIVVWPDGKSQIVTNVKADQVLSVSYKDAGDQPYSLVSPPAEPIVEQVNKKLDINFRHEEEDRIDFNLQRTLPHKFSQLGPGIAVGDVNGDGLEDFFVGGSVKMAGSFFIQKANGKFSINKLKAPSPKGEEDEASLLFDADNDGDLDLYVVSGGFEYEPEHEAYQDRLYLNDGKGNFTLNVNALPALKLSEACVRAADYDGDGDLDLFTGARISPRSYPLSGESCILRNDNGKFTNITNDICAELKDGGMITDAIWTDYDNDGKLDLITTGEFMPIAVYHNDGKSLKKELNTGLEKYSGWWNSITAGDFDGDGDMDYVAGNLGKNNYYKASDKTPLRIYAKDIDGNGSVDAILSCYFRSETDSLIEYPLHFWDELNTQSPKFRRKFAYYREYGRAPMSKLFTPEEREGMIIKEVNYTLTSYIENKGGGKFEVKALPMLTQVAPVNGLITEDVNNDGNLDVIMVGNDYGNEVFTGRYDAFTGLILLGDGKGNFEVLPSAKSGFLVSGDAKSLVRLTGKETDLFIASQNQDSLKVFARKTPVKNFSFQPQTLDVWAELIFTDGKKQKVEFNYGSGYLSQSSRRLRVPANVKEIVVHDSKGGSRSVIPKSL